MDDRPPSPKKEIKLEVLQQKGFVTADIHRGYDAAYIVFAMRDFILYLIYLACLLLIAVGSKYSAHNYYSDMIDDLLTDASFSTPIIPGTSVIGTLHSIKTPQQIWRFVEEVLMEFLYDDKDPLKRGSQVLLESILVGAPAIRQLRVLNNTCETAPLFKDLYKTCYDYYSYDLKDRSNLDSIYTANNLRSKPWEYFSESILAEDTAPYHGIMGSYGGGGLKVNLTSDRIFNQKWLDELEKANWIRIGARFVTIDFSLYTPNTNLFCLAKLNFELIPAGGVITEHQFYTMKLFRYSTAYDTFILACEIIFICFTVYFTFEEGQQMYILKEDYLTNWWNILDIIIIVLSYLTIGFGIYRFAVVTSSVSEQILLIRTSTNSNFDNIIHVQNLFNQIMAWLVFLAWIKLLKFSSLNRSIVAILSAFHHVGEELLAVASMALMITTGYAVCGHILFGYVVYDFVNVRRSIYTMMSMYIGRLNFYRMCHLEYPVIAPIFFTTYIIIIVIVYFNMFVALLVHGFSKIKIFMNEDPDRLFLDDWVYAIVLHLLVMLRQYHTAQKLMARNLLGRLERDYNELIQILKRHGFQGTELHLLLQSYEIRRGSELKLDVMYDLYNDICVRKQLYIEVEDHNDILKVMDKIDKMIEHCDQAILDVMAKSEILTDMLARTELRPILSDPKARGKK